MNVSAVSQGLRRELIHNGFCFSPDTVLSYLRKGAQLSKLPKKCREKFIIEVISTLAALENCDTRLVQKYREILHFLFQLRVSFNFTNGSGCTPLWFTILHNNVKLAGLLLQHGADPNFGIFTPFHKAIEFKEPEIVRVMLQYGADPCHPLPERMYLKIRDMILLRMLYENHYCNTPLHMVAQATCKAAECHKIARLLIEYGASRHATNSRGQRPFEIATDSRIKQLLTIKRKKYLWCKVTEPGRVVWSLV